MIVHLFKGYAVAMDAHFHRFSTTMQDKYEAGKDIGDWNTIMMSHLSFYNVAIAKGVWGKKTEEQLKLEQQEQEIIYMKALVEG